MLKILATIVVFAIIGFFAYRELGTTPPLSPREALEEQVTQISKSKKLSAEEADLFRLQMALLAHTAKYHQPPDSLTQLVPTYFDELPVNPKTGEVYKYKRDGNRPLLGDMVDRAEGKTVAKNADGATRAKASAVSDADFINPNDMQLEKFVYSATDKRDPFQPFDMAPKRTGDATLSPLEQFALGQLRLTAVLSSTGGNSTAIVETAEGKGYTVKAGTKIGTNNGVVVSVEKDRLKILETSVSFTGEESQQVQELILQVGDQTAEEVKKKPKKR